MNLILRGTVTLAAFVSWNICDLCVFICDNATSGCHL